MNLIVNDSAVELTKILDQRCSFIEYEMLEIIRNISLKAQVFNPAGRYQE